ncbi:thiamine biosynthesis protein ApbE [Pseudolabrys sp. Root1462]|uniref:FAD:protein FMN transferase n=1 Tax=Pseudolabrys sp. Root1462 TaxID=1736466 RepID=UPI0007033657|nr:FAD:protein FMN transferase [Pseudolabrys sp. Root1462]KQY99402.1 thiamine biosynthesis protein ApbE [Pseudolabrys sp. Root1462]
MNRKVTRRRFIRIAAIAGGTSLLPSIAFARSSSAGLRQWRGIALGADASLQVFHPDPAAADRLIAASLDEVLRLEGIFSLYRQDSDLARLNRDGRLDAPAPEMVELLSIAAQFSRLTAGAFDVTVQPLWELYAKHFSLPNADPAGPTEAALAAARALVGYEALEIDAARVCLLQPGAKVTLNGIAQGYVTDRVADVLRAAGCEHTLVDMGEIRAIGAHPAGRPWDVAIRDPRDGSRTFAGLQLDNMSVATSSGMGTPFDATGRFNHIFDPSKGTCASKYLSVSVKTMRATSADALSTALSLMPTEAATSVLQATGGGEALFWEKSRTLTSIQVA